MEIPKVSEKLYSSSSAPPAPSAPHLPISPSPHPFFRSPLIVGERTFHGNFEIAFGGSFGNIGDACFAAYFHAKF